MWFQNLLARMETDAFSVIIMDIHLAYRLYGGYEKRTADRYQVLIKGLCSDNAEIRAACMEILQKDQSMHFWITLLGYEQVFPCEVWECFHEYIRNNDSPGCLEILHTRLLKYAENNPHVVVKWAVEHINPFAAFAK